ncbi:hypothetical protein [Clostridium sp. HBUAS56010]|uniref:hypothetical protein n=1 Tax=Clostridium sp. HBUAS56010 TaxID=2571127 RepID=UPI0011775C53|nr:hypothetical protein [Clostridium sp. HBUAS56010]
MYEEMEEEYLQFLYDMEESIDFARYMDEGDYEDDYGNNEIYEYQEKFAEKVVDWLREHKPGKYIVSRGWYIGVMTPDAAKEHKISESSIEEMIVR